MELKTDVEVSTAYLLLDVPCYGNCAFCSQAIDHQQKDFLSRIIWPLFDLDEVISALSKNLSQSKIKRICIQAQINHETPEKIVTLVKALRSVTTLPISLSWRPKSVEEVDHLFEIGVSRIGISVDLATPTLFDEIKGSIRGININYESVVSMINLIKNRHGSNKITTHLIIGLGETPQEVVSFLQEMYSNSIKVALFAFTPLRGTVLQDLPRPDIVKYRLIQLTNFLLKSKPDLEILFSDDQRITKIIIPSKFKEIIQTGKPFLTSGCTSCNRPYYNEKPSDKELYNYPRPLLKEESENIVQQIESFISWLD
jgi:biotin synthase